MTQIEYLNKTVKCRLGVSNIHGIGVFAIRDILQGEELHIQDQHSDFEIFTVPYSKFNELLPEVAELILNHWPAIRNGSFFKAPNQETNFLSYMNHSRNANYQLETDTAIKNISKDEEITNDYRKMLNAFKIFNFL